MKIHISVATLIALSLAGCTKAVTVLEPMQPITAPVTEFKVQFSSFFKPGTFIAEFDGQDVTSGFTPAAVAGGTARLVMPDSNEGFRGGQWFSRGLPPQPISVGTLPSDIQFTPAAAPPSAGSPPATGTGKPPPNITMYFHTLRVSGQCSGLICSVTDEAIFFPVHLVGIPTSLTLRIGQTAQVSVETFPVMKTPVTVQVRPSSVSVRLEGAAPGAPINVLIPANGPSQPFKVTGMVSSNLLLLIEARGMQLGSISGLVNP